METGADGATVCSGEGLHTKTRKQRQAKTNKDKQTQKGCQEINEGSPNAGPEETMEKRKSRESLIYGESNRLGSEETREVKRSGKRGR